MVKSVIDNSDIEEKIKIKLNEKEGLINKKLANLAFRTENYHEVPPIIGIIIADQYGNTILVVEYKNGKSSNYGPIKSYLTDDDKSLLEIDLISMYFSSLKTFASQTNIKNLSHLQIYGSNIKVQIYFLFNKFMLIVFLNSCTDLKSREKSKIFDFFKDKLTKFEYEFDNFNLSQSRNIIIELEYKGISLMKKLNNEYLQNYTKNYSVKLDFIEKIIQEIEPIIKNELNEYLKNLPNELQDNIVREINCKIQDKLFEIQQTIFKL